MIGVCITAKNEETTIGDLARHLNWCQVYICDDGSTDQTGANAQEAGALVVRHSQSQGIGPSLMELWQLALINGCERIVQLDAGGSHDPRDLLGLLAVEADVVVGSRFPTGGKV